MADRVLDGAPEQVWHCAEAVKTRLGGAILVVQRSPILKGQNTGDGFFAVKRKTNRGGTSHALHEILKPSPWLGWQSVAPAGLQDEIVKPLHQAGIVSLLDPDSLFFGMPYPPLNAVPVRAAEHCIGSRAKIEPMEIKLLTAFPVRLDRWKRGRRPEFHVFAALLPAPLLTCRKQAMKIRRARHQRIAVIGVGNRNQPPPREPAGHPAKHHRAEQIAVRPQHAERNRLVAVCRTDRLQPAAGVKHRRTGTSTEKTRPPGIRQWINFVDHRFPSLEHRFLISKWKSALWCTKVVSRSLIAGYEKTAIGGRKPSRPPGRRA